MHQVCNYKGNKSDFKISGTSNEIRVTSKKTAVIADCRDSKSNRPNHKSKKS